MLTELQHLHHTILAKLDELDVLTKEAEPPINRLPAARLALTRASRARTLHLEACYDALIAQAPAHRKAALEALRAEGKSRTIESVKHIGSWTLREILKRWPEYCDASNAMRAAMRKRVREEAALLYPSQSDRRPNWQPEPSQSARRELPGVSAF